MKSLLKKIYKALPFKREVFTILKKVWLPSERIYRHLHFRGVFTVRVDKGVSFKIRHYGFLIENEVFIRRVDLMKIDVETHEPEVLEGMGKYLEQFAPPMLIEILNDEVGEKVERLVRNNGYLYFNINDEAGTLRRVDHIVKSDFWNYFLCSPETAKELGLVV